MVVLILFEFLFHFDSLAAHCDLFGGKGLLIVLPHNSRSHIVECLADLNEKTLQIVAGEHLGILT